MVTPLGSNPLEVLNRVQQGECAATAPSHFNATAFACPVCATIPDFQVQPFVSEAKTARLMNRDAQLAVAAARLALRDANLAIGRDYAPEEVGLYGATGLAGLPINEVAPLIRASSATDGSFELTRFGSAGLKAVSPILSFKILGNMPICFVAINEGIRGPNAIFTPWEGQGMQAVETGLRALRNGQVRAVLVGGCDVKTHELSFLGLEQQGVFDSWKKTGRGVIPGEGSVFLVLERQAEARNRGARIYAELSRLELRTHRKCSDFFATYCEVLERTVVGCERSFNVVLSANGDESKQHHEGAALKNLQIRAENSLSPKKQVGDLFAAAGLLQVALAALVTQKQGGVTLANCFGHGSEQATAVLNCV